MREDRFIPKVQAWCFKNYGTQRAAALAIGISPVTLNNAIKGRTAMPRKLLLAMGYEMKEKPIDYVRIKE